MARQDKLDKTELLDALAESFGVAKKPEHTSKFDESTKTLYTDEEVARQKIHQVKVVSLSKEEKKTPDTLDDALKEFTERKKINDDYEKEQKKLSSAYIVKDEKAKWNSVISKNKY